MTTFRKYTQILDSLRAIISNMMILGIDPGTARMGYSVMDVNDKSKKAKLVETSVILTSSELDMHKRLKVLYTELNSIVKKHIPRVMVIEKLFFNTNAKTAINVGQARGISLLVAANSKMDVYEYTALEAKFALTGYGRADKKEVQASVKKLLNLPEIIKSDDANDAVAIVLCHVKKSII